MNIEALLKLKCQQALAQGDYDLVSSYSQQLIMLQQGVLLGEMPIGEELKSLNKTYQAFLHDDANWDVLILHFKQFYGEDLTKVGLDFFYEFGSAELCDAIWASRQ